MDLKAAAFDAGGTALIRHALANDSRRDALKAIVGQMQAITADQGHRL